MYFDQATDGSETRSVYADDAIRQRSKAPEFRISDFVQFAEILSEKRAQFLSLIKDIEMREYLVDTWQVITGVKLNQAQLVYAGLANK
jgi:hypothetical protein